MASDYGYNFGFRRSDEAYRDSDGRLRTPAGSNLLLGTAVKQNTATPTELAACAADDELIPGASGLLVQELAWLRDRDQSAPGMQDSYEINRALPGHLSVMTAGAAVKVWFRNNAAINRADGRVIAAVEMVDFVNDGAGSANVPAVGDELGWSGSQWVVVDGVTITNAWMRITNVNASREYLEATLLG